MAKYEVTSPDGRSAIIIAPADVPESEVMAFAQESWEQWKDGGTYEMVADEGEQAPSLAPMSPRAIEMAAGGDTAKSAMKTAKNERADAKVAALEKQKADLLRQMQALDPENTSEMQDLWNQYGAAEAELAKYSIGSAGETVGGMAGGAAGAMAGAGLGALGGPAAPITIPLGAAIGGVLGAAGGSMAGTHLYDIPAAREARDITDEEAAALIRQRGIESVLFDGAFMLILGPGGKVVGKVARGSRLGPALRAAARETFDWTKAADKERIAKIAAGRANEAPGDLTASVSSAVGVTKAEPLKATQEVVEELAERTGGKIPTKGEMTGEVVGRERSARKLAPEPFAHNDKMLADAAKEMREDALATLDRQGARTGIPLGEAIQQVQKSADAALKVRTRPAFEAAEQIGVRVPTTDVKMYVDDLLKKDRNAAGGLLSEAERGYFTKLSERLTVYRRKPDGTMEAIPGRSKPLTAEGMLDWLSGLKDKARELGVDGQPSKKMERFANDLVRIGDASYDDAARNIAGMDDIADELIAARKLYRETMGDLYSDSMAALANKTPEDVGRSLRTSGTETEIREIRKALLRAEQDAPAQRINRPDRAPIMSRADMVEERRRIDAGLIKGFLEKNTVSLEQLETKLKDPDFKATLKELLTGPGAADPAFNKQLLNDLDKVAAAVKLADPSLAPTPGRVGVSGQGAVLAGVGHQTLGLGGMFAALAAYITGKTALAKLTANAMTTHNTGTIRKLGRAIALSKNARTNVAAAEMLAGLLKEIEAEIGPPDAPTGE